MIFATVRRKGTDIEVREEELNVEEEERNVDMG